MPPSNQDLLAVGRFVIRTADATQSGLAAHEVLELAAQSPDAALDIFAIHRLDESGSMELRGVTLTEIERESGAIIARGDVRTARADYDAIVEHAEGHPPPCRIEVEFVRVAAWQEPCVTAMRFSFACDDGVRQWLAGIGGSTSSAERDEGDLARYRSAERQVVMTARLEPMAALRER